MEFAFLGKGYLTQGNFSKSVPLPLNFMISIFFEKFKHYFKVYMHAKHF